RLHDVDEVRRAADLLRDFGRGHARGEQGANLCGLRSSRGTTTRCSFRHERIVQSEVNGEKRDVENPLPQAQEGPPPEGRTKTPAYPGQPLLVGRWRSLCADPRWRPNRRDQDVGNLGPSHGSDATHTG